MQNKLVEVQVRSGVYMDKKGGLGVVTLGEVDLNGLKLPAIQVHSPDEESETKEFESTFLMSDKERTEDLARMIYKSEYLGPL